MAYTTDLLVAAIKLRGMIPTAAGKTFTPEDFLSLASDEMRSVIVPAILSVRQDYYLWKQDFAPVQDPADPTGRTLGPFQMPYRAIGTDPKLVQLLDSSGRPTEIGRVQIEDLPYCGFGHYFVNNKISVATNAGAAWSAVRVWYFLRTNALVTTDRVAAVTGFNLTAKTATVAAVPTAWGAGPVSLDIVKYRPGFDTLAFDAAASIAGTTLTFSAALPADLAVGDQLSLSDESAVVQVPVEFQACLAQAVVCRCLEAIGDREGLAAADVKFQKMMAGAVKLIMNRDAGNPTTILAIHSPIRRRY